MPAVERTPPISIEAAADLDHFTEQNVRVMRERLAHGAAKFGALSWRTETYTDGDNLDRLLRAVDHLHAALNQYRSDAADVSELRKRAADVANQAFMYADPERDWTPPWPGEPQEGKR